MSESSDTADSRSQRLELAIAMLLGAAAVLTAIAAFQADSRGGDATTEYNLGIRSADAASQAFTEGTQQLVQDQALFLEYAKAANTGDDDLALYLRESLFSAELEAGVAWWEEQPDDEDSAPSPFVEENPDYVIVGYEAGAELEAETEQHFADAARFDEEGGEYTLMTVILAVALFLLGITAAISVFAIRVGMVAVGGGITLAAAIWLVLLAP